MQLGLRPRLKGRPSFLDLIRQRNIDQLSIAAAKLVNLPEVHPASTIPLPSSPRLSLLSPPPTPIFEEIPEAAEQLQEPVTMAPVSFESFRHARALVELTTHLIEDQGRSRRRAIWSVNLHCI
jgi:hypothetical protein